MKVIVLGSGAMGCLFGAAFHRAGAKVTLVDVNKRHVDAINKHGLTVDLRSGTQTLPVRAALPAEIDTLADLVLVFTKTFHTTAALEGISAGIGNQTHLLSLQNGLGNDRRLAGFASDDRVIVGASMLPSDLVGPGHIRSHGDGYSKLYPAFGTDTAMARQAADMLTEGGLETVLDPAIHGVIWSKAIFNAVMNPLCALTRRTPGFLGQNEQSRAMILTAVAEGIAAAHANGIMLDGQPIYDLTEVSMKDHADHEPSMLQDIHAGRRTEVDAIAGAIVTSAKNAGVAAPVMETLWQLVKLEEAKLA
ncbi:MAG: 2-dehydropantoate 2-reductase [Alteraurantiacibacter sp.]